MTHERKRRIGAGILVALGLSIGIIGAIGMIAPPIITGVGFLTLAWVLW